MKFPHTNRNGALIALVDIVTMGFFLLFYIRPIEREIKTITKKNFIGYGWAFLLGLFTFILPNIFWISFRAEELETKAKELGIKGKLTSFNHMFYWNTFGLLLLIGPFLATHRFFDTLNKIERHLNETEEDHG